MGMNRRPILGLWLGGMALALAASAPPARADFSTDRPGSILILPKVVSDGVRDTLIEVTNRNNTLAHAHCFYVNGARLNPEAPPDPDTNPALWQETDFFIWLTRQHPTQWQASQGRSVDPTDFAGKRGCGTGPRTRASRSAGIHGRACLYRSGREWRADCRKLARRQRDTGGSRR
ncbi:MAG: hypothetical protein KatS3mg076_0140 [Candidatus Binatia bacterium]|nr:MAG: hypothetical protein KatS3mg076_0140 [Candidatus Binatia bacterium]